MSYWTTHPRLAELRFGSRTLAPAIGSILVLVMAAPLFFNSATSVFVRLVVCPSTLYIANDAFNRLAKVWLWVMVAIAAVFNPVMVMQGWGMDAESWALLDLLTAMVFLAWIMLLPNVEGHRRATVLAEVARLPAVPRCDDMITWLERQGLYVARLDMWHDYQRLGIAPPVEDQEDWARGASFIDGSAGKRSGSTIITKFRRAAEQGDARAQYFLGSMFDVDVHDADVREGVPQDDAVEAAKWYRRAAEQGHAQAQYALGFMYTNGSGVPENYMEAHKWLSLSEASDGSGVPQNYPYFVFDYDLAEGEVGEPEPNPVRAMVVATRLMIENRMTAEQVVEAQRRAREWTSTPEP